MEEKTILVTGIGGNVGQGVLRNIRSMGRNIRLVGTDIAQFNAGCHLCDATYKVPYSYDPSYLDTVRDIVRRENISLIIPTTDYEVFYLSDAASTLGAPVVASEASVAKRYLDKYETYLYHTKYGIPFSKSWLPSEYDGACADIILKPREGRGSRGIHINPENPTSFSDDYMIQPRHEGIEITTAFYVTKSGKLHGLITMDRELANGATSRSTVNRRWDGRLQTIIEQMIALGGLHGSLNLQSIVTPDDDIIPFEVNCRISGTNSIRHNLGFRDVVYTVQEHLYHEEPEKPNVIDGIAVRLLYDVIYPGATNETQLTHNRCGHIIY